MERLPTNRLEQERLAGEARNLPAPPEKAERVEQARKAERREQLDRVERHAKEDRPDAV